MKKMIIITPHLSTGGLPQFLFKKIEILLKKYDIYLVEWSNITGGRLVVQRDRIFNLLGEKLITLGDQKDLIFNIISQIDPDIVHFEEFPETFIDDYILDVIYTKFRSYLKSLYEVNK